VLHCSMKICIVLPAFIFARMAFREWPAMRPWLRFFLVQG
jgi:hypothetical protein